MVNNNSDRNNFENAEEAFDFLVSEKQKQKLKARWKEQMNEHSETVEIDKSTSKNFYGIVSGIAAVLIFGLAIWTFNKEPTLEKITSDLIAESQVLLPKDISSRGVDENLNIELETLINRSFEDENYQEIINSFESSTLRQDIDLKYQFYYALALLKSNENIEGNVVSVFEEIEEKVPALKFESQWYKILALLKLKDIPQAKKELTQFLKESSYQKENIELLLKRIGE